MKRTRVGNPSGSRLPSAGVAYNFKIRLVTSAATFALAIALAGCGHKHEEGDGHDHGNKEAHGHGKDDGHDHGGEAPSGASFTAGHGVVMTAETKGLLGVEVADVTEQKLPQQIRFNVQIFGEKHQHAMRDDDHRGCDVHGSGFVPLDQAAVLRAGQPVQIQTRTNESLTGVVLAVEKAFSLGESEVIIGATNAMDKLKPGEFLPAVVTLPRAAVVPVIPRSALLRTAEGAFVYVANGAAFFRTAVKVGSEADGRLEITEGLRPGTVVVTKPVQTLWLIELRATKGGGHAH